MKMGTVIIIILCLVLPIITPSQQWLTAHKLTYLPLSVGIIFLLLMISLSLGVSGAIFSWYDYGIVSLVCLETSWQIVK
ncbi:hypothetical protein [Levilactobacillus suantsaii]|uniref:hypothetical protein n=1 Tax=Levilactobacillus suantsaii TaxID=2292255 RepID=UPI001F3937CB|nr:hypothetical protein [Levilactobacillus suantsaii]